MRIRLFALLAALILGLGLFGPALAEEGPAVAPRAAPTTRIEVTPLAPLEIAPFDPVKATNGYLAKIPAKDRARSDAYFEGGYVLQAVDILYALAVTALLLWLNLSSRMRDFAEGLSKRRFWQVPIYTAGYIAVTTVATLPLTIYEGYFREHTYGLSNQTFGQWFGEFSISFLIEVIALSLAVALIYAAARKAGRAWWKWGAGIAVVFIIVANIAGPVFIEPLYNKYTPLPESATRNAILSMARSQGVPAKNVYLVDASKQSTRVSANVAGLFGTTRIALNDNLLNRCTPSEVLAVLGHEIGHYVMNHVVISITWMALILVFGFWLVDVAFHRLAAVFGIRWGVRGIDDPAGLPLVFALLSLYMFLATPALNTITRMQETQADIFGLNMVRQPDALSNVVLKLSEYRKMDPSPVEEFLFFDHPSGKNRILTSMRWKAEHMHDADIMDGPKSPQ